MTWCDACRAGADTMYCVHTSWNPAPPSARVTMSTAAEIMRDLDRQLDANTQHQAGAYIRLNAAQLALRDLVIQREHIEATMIRTLAAALVK